MISLSHKKGMRSNQTKRNGTRCVPPQRILIQNPSPHFKRFMEAASCEPCVLCGCSLFKFLVPPFHPRRCDTSPTLKNTFIMHTSSHLFIPLTIFIYIIFFKLFRAYSNHTYHMASLKRGAPNCQSVRSIIPEQRAVFSDTITERVADVDHQILDLESLERRLIRERNILLARIQQRRDSDSNTVNSASLS